MHSRLLVILSCLLPLAALAANGSPIIIFGEDAPSNAPIERAGATGAVPGAEFPNFPKNAITRVGNNTTGQLVDAPANPESPKNPENPASPPAPPTPEAPTSPTPPPNPVSKLWPRDTIAIFLPSCTGFRPQFIAPCTCVITKLMAAMPHDEFLKMSEAGTIEQDPRLIRIRTDCASAPQKKE
jgi:hypothetical protein